MFLKARMGNSPDTWTILAWCLSHGECKQFSQKALQIGHSKLLGHPHLSEGPGVISPEQSPLLDCAGVRVPEK